MNYNRRILFASLTGSTIEWFDFFLYGTASALVFAKEYFPNDNPTISLLLSYGSFAVSFLVRPFGGALFAHIGDRVGRKITLIYTLSLMGAGTVLIGLLPPYASIGLLAPALLILFRMVQGLGLGGEWGGAILLAVENAPTNRKGLYGSIPQIGVTAGLLLSTLALAVLTRLPDALFMSWGWRLPFLASAGLFGLGLWMRSGLDETREFAAVRDAGRLYRLPVFETLRNQGREVVQAIGAKLVDATPFYIATVFVISYGTGILGYPRADILTAICVGAIVGTFTIPVAGMLADRFGVRRVFLCGCAAVMPAGYLYFELLATQTTAGLISATILIVGVAWTVPMATLGTLLSEMFPTEVRYSGITLGYQIGVALAGGTAPLLATYILTVDQNHWRWIAFFIAASGAIAGLAVKATRSRPIAAG
jgi:MFS family permease